MFYRMIMSVVAAGVLAGALVTPKVEALDLAAWQQELIGHVRKSFIYPRSAIRLGIEGTAQVEITIDASGAITKYVVVQESGEKVLDRTIEKIIKKMDPVPKPHSDMDTTDLKLVLPLTWRLQ